MKIRVAVFIGIVLLFAVEGPQMARAQDIAEQKLIRQAYDYAFPLYLLSEYRWTALETTGGRTSTTLNHFAHSRSLATPDDKWANAPSVDELYSTAWMDLSQGPVFIDTPDTHGRYYVLTLIDFYSNTFFYIGHRTTGTAAQKYLLVGSTWQGKVPAEATLVRSPTNDVYVNLRVKTDGPADQAAANAIQDGFLVTPAGTPAQQSVERIKPVSGDAQNYVDVANQMLQLDPPPDRDRSLVERYRKVGICGAGCSWDALPEGTRAEWKSLYPTLGQFMANFVSKGATNSWIDYNPPGSNLGTADQRDYYERAYALAAGTGMLGMSRDEADYWTTFTDNRGEHLMGSKRYRLHLPPGGFPSNAFWSVTLDEVEKDGQFLTPNPINRYEISSFSRPGRESRRQHRYLDPVHRAGSGQAGQLVTQSLRRERISAFCAFLRAQA